MKTKSVGEGHKAGLKELSMHALNGFIAPNVMWGVVISLIPVVVASVWFFRGLAIRLISSCVAGCVITEAVIRKLRGKKITVSYGSAVVTGILLAAVLPPSLSLWLAALGSVVAIGIGKELFGGLGCNIFNPSLIGRLFLMAAFPVALTSWTNPLTLDATTKATPLALMKFRHAATDTMDLFLGNISGSLGETSALAIIIGGCYLFIKKYADWRVTFGYLLTVALFGGALHLLNPYLYPSALFHILAGGLLLGAVFMATDPVTSPVTKSGRYAFGAGCGILTIVIRIASGLPEGVMYAILFMNGLTPIINRIRASQKSIFYN